MFRISVEFVLSSVVPCFTVMLTVINGHLRSILSIFFKVASVALELSCIAALLLLLRASEAALKNMGKIETNQTATKHKNTQKVCIFLRTLCVTPLFHIQ